MRRFRRQNESSIKRDVVLLCIGALISFVTSLTISIVNNYQIDKKERLDRKMKLNEELAADLGERLYCTELMFKGKLNSIADSDSIYISSKYKWNRNKYKYEALIEYYYGEDIGNEYRDSIYLPLNTFGNTVVNYNAEDAKNNYKAFWNNRGVITKRQREFIQKLFAEAE